MDWEVCASCATDFPTFQTLRLRPGVSLLSLALLVLLSASSATSQPRVVSDQDSFYAALADSSVTHIQLAKSITINPNKGPGSWPLLVARDCLVDGALGSSYPRLDLSFAKNDRVQLAPGVTLTFRGLVLSNVFSSSSVVLDFFAPSGAASVIVWEGVVDRRSVCRPIQAVMDAWANLPRPKGTEAPLGSPPPPSSSAPALEPTSQQQQQQQQQRQQQVAVVDGPNCNGDRGCYATPVLRSFDVVLESPAGYLLRLNNTLTVCDQFISEACIQSLGSDLCYLNVMEDLKGKLHASFSSSSAASASSAGKSYSGSGGLSSEAQAGIIAGCVVGGVALLVLLITLMVCHRRRRTRRAVQRYDASVEGPVFTVLEPSSEAALQVYGSTRSADTATSTAAGHAPHRTAEVTKIASAKTAFRGGGGGGGGDGRPSADRSNSTDARMSPGPVALAAALESAGSSYKVVGSAPASGGLRPSGSGTRDGALVLNSGSTQPTLPRHSEQSQQAGAAAAAGGGSNGGVQHPHSMGPFVMGMLRSVLHRAGSHTHERGAGGGTGRGSTGGGGGGGSSAALVSGSGTAVVAMPAGPVSAGAGPSGGGGTPRSAALPSGSPTAAPVRRAASLKSSGVASGPTGPAPPPAPSRPSLGEIKQELERMEDEWLRESTKAAAKKAPRTSTSTRGRSPRSRSLEQPGRAAGQAREQQQGQQGQQG